MPFASSLRDILLALLGRRRGAPGGSGDSTSRGAPRAAAAPSGRAVARRRFVDDSSSKTISCPPQAPGLTEKTLPLPRRNPMTGDMVSVRVQEWLTARLETLTTLPTVMTDLVAMLQDPDAPPRDVARLASTDPAVAAEILRTVNSAATGLREHVKDVGHAILLLGYNQVKFLVMRLGMDGSVGASARPEDRVKMASIWRHSYLASEAASLLVRHHAGGAGAEASTAALLHDVGKLLILELPAREDLDTKNVFQAGVLSADGRIFVEEDYYGVHHCLIGERIAAKLQFPPAVRLAVSRHHHPLDSDDLAGAPRDLLRVLALVKLADSLAHDFAERLEAPSGPAAAHGVGEIEMAEFRRILPGLPGYSSLLAGIHTPLHRAAAFLDSMAPQQATEESVTSGAGRIYRSSPAAPSGGAQPQLVAGRYKLLQDLGEGAAGSVHLCEDTLLGQRFAIKILRPLRQRSDPGFETFLNEARVAMKLTHPNIIRVFHLDVRDGVCFILQEFVDGQTLAQLLKKARGGRMEESEALRIAVPLARALAYAHENDVIHRDLSPRNVMIDAQGDVKLLDFGVATYRRLDGVARTGGTEHVVGTPSYMSPEHWEGNGEVDRRSDVYSFGALLHTMLSGSVPFPHDTLEDLRRLQRTSRPQPLVWVSEPLRKIVDRSLDPDPSARWQEFRILAAELEALSGNRAAQARGLVLEAPVG